MIVRLTAFELIKIWQKRSFILSCCVLLAVNLFLTWYIYLPNEETPPMSAYKALNNDISTMSEVERGEYITELKDRIDGINFVESIQSLRAMGNEMGDTLAEEKLDDAPGVFEKYYESYQNGNYLLYTDSLSQESAFINELYEEYSKVSGYSEYLASVQKNRVTLEGISIFQDSGKTDFTSRNIEKSAADYAALEKVQLRWQPSKGISAVMESRITDILLFSGVLLFVGGLITEEKEKGLFHISRATRHGISASIISKLLAMLIHCVGMTVAMLGVGLLFSSATMGLGDLTVSIQSLAPYMESSLSISVLEYIVLSVLTKSITLFCFGAMLTGLAIYCSKGFAPYFAGLGMIGLSGALCFGIPAYSILNPLKYMNFIGFMETEQLYGAYLNLNILGWPVSRLALTLAVLGIAVLVSAAACLCLFLQGGNLELAKTPHSLPICFKPHNNLFRHEAYKLLITNKALLILLCFAVLLGYYGCSQKYYSSAGEQYYQSMMQQLEGELDDNKENLILSERERYEEAYLKLSQIDALTESGKLDSAASEAMKLEWEAVLTFYPSFQRVEQQYERVKQNGGEFVYDTGYLYLFGKMDDSFLINLLLLSVCMVLAFYNGISMEYKRKSWELLGASKAGRRKIIMRKLWICIICAMAMTLVPWIFRSICISKVFPLAEWHTLIQNIPAFEGVCIKMPVICFTLIVIISQMLAVMLTGILTLGISAWRRNDIQAMFFSLLLLVIPLVLKLMGLEPTGWFSVYPVYAWSGL